jgi:hypothetical protein
MWVMMMVMVMVGMYYHHNLRLRSIWHCKRYCEAEGENGSEDYLFHTLW